MKCGIQIVTAKARRMFPGVLLLMALPLMSACGGSPNLDAAAASAQPAQPVLALLTAAPTPTSAPLLTATPFPDYTGEPDYIKKVVAFREGVGGVVVYFVLADKDGREVAHDGTVEVRMHCIENDLRKGMIAEDWWILKTLPWPLPVRAGDFHMAPVGAREMLVHSLGRITYDRFPDEWKKRGCWKAEVYVRFETIPRSDPLEGKTVFVFDNREYGALA